MTTSEESFSKGAYAVLEVAIDADDATLQEAYRRKAQQYHPDKVSHLGPEFRELAEKRMREINAAYDLLRNPETRRAYDRQRQSDAPPSEAAEPAASTTSTSKPKPSSPMTFQPLSVSRVFRRRVVLGVVGGIVVLFAAMGLLNRGTSPARQARTAEAFRQAQEFFGNGDWEEALVLLQQVTKAQPDNLEAWTLRWRTELTLQLYEDGRNSLERAMALDGGNPTLRVEYARVLFVLGDLNALRAELLWLQKNGETTTVVALLEAFRAQNPARAAQLTESIR
jgi:curved DNA-binding protein CbpA